MADGSGPGRTVLQSAPVAFPVGSVGIPLDTTLRGHQRRCLHPHDGDEIGRERNADTLEAGSNRSLSSLTSTS